MEHSFFNVVVPITDGRLLVYNSLSLDLIVISSDEYGQLITGRYPEWHPRLVDLANSGFITPCAKTQYSETADRDYLYKKSNPFIHMTIMMTESCNFSCAYCNQGQNKESEVLSEQVVNEICNYIRTTSCKGSDVDVSWFGGEPLLQLDTLLKSSQRLQEACDSTGAIYRARVITNGFLLNKKNAIKLYSNNINVAQVSFDGSKLAHDQSRYVLKGIGTYDLILKNLLEVLEEAPSDFKISLRVNVSAANLHTLPELIDDLEKRRFNQFKNFVVYWGHIYDPTTSDIDDAENIDDILLSHGTFGKAELEMNRLLVSKGFRASHTINETRGNCIATQSNSFVIRPNGELHKCYIPVSNKANACGTIYDVNATLQSEIYQRWNSWSAFSEDSCSKCRLLASCRGGCPINYISDNYKNMTYKCPPSKMYFNEYLFDRALRQGIVQANHWDEQRSPTSLESFMIPELTSHLEQLR